MNRLHDQYWFVTWRKVLLSRIPATGGSLAEVGHLLRRCEEFHDLLSSAGLIRMV
jgi:hypothetical protein